MGVRTILPCFLTLLTLLVFLLHGSDADNKGKLPSATVVGAVYCDTCFHQEFSKASHSISGAVVAVECGGGGTVGDGFFRKDARTNEHGVFRVGLPPEFGKHPKRIEACSVKLVSSGEPFCAVAASAAASTSSLRRLRSGKRGLHVFSAGFFTFKPLQQPELCYQKPIPADATPTSKWFRDQKPDQSSFFLPPNPLQPPSVLPPNPFQPPSVLPPNPLQPPSVLPPNPLQPPSVLPPNPFQPPPSLLPPNPFQPPPSVFPPVPGLTPPPTPSFKFPPILGFNPPPPPPAFRFPPFPFPPNFPGIPPSKGTAP